MSYVNIMNEMTNKIDKLSKKIRKLESENKVLSNF